jgi:uncharacterized membrane protein YozB (DUF420 family)
MDNSLITLLIYLIALLPLMFLGFFFARRKMFTQHKLTMTTIFIANWVLIAWIMSPSYRGMAQSPESVSQFRFSLATIHLVAGGIAQIIATYLVILMWTERTPLERLVPFRIKNIKTPMRFTLSLWIIAVLLGVGLFATRPTASASDTTDNLPVSTEEASEEAPSPESTEALEEAPSPLVTEQVPAPATTEESDDDSGQGRGRGRGRGGDDDDDDDNSGSGSDDDDDDNSGSGSDDDD